MKAELDKEAYKCDENALLDLSILNIGAENEDVNLEITNDALSEYGNGNTKILDLDYQFSNYSTHVSDHRPVLAQFPVLTN